MARQASKKPSKKTSAKPTGKKPSKRSVRSKKSESESKEEPKSGWERLFEVVKELDLDPSLLMRGGTMVLERLGRVIDVHGYRKLPADTIRIGISVDCYNREPRTIDISGPPGQHLDIFGVRAICEPQKIMIEGIATKEDHAYWKAAHEARVARAARGELDPWPSSTMYRPPSPVNSIDAALLVPPDWAEYVHLPAYNVSDKNPLVVTFSPRYPTDTPLYLDLTFFAHDTGKRRELTELIQAVGHMIRQKAMTDDDDEVWDEQQQTH